MLSLQIVSDHEELLRKLDKGTSEHCCFDQEDIVTESVVFGSDDDPAAVARRIFVCSYTHVHFSPYV